MSLAPGTRVGPYEVVGSIGAGGMGEVCRARDTKLNRDVALKVLPDAFAADPDRMTRFQREAQLLAALNHPNIAAIYGLEDEGSHRAIVMELVEGQTLAGPLPVADALPLARQITEAIEYAHDRGIIHRDLKPANIKVTPDGSVKVLDFGLAKAMDDSTDPVTNVLATMSPTLSLAATHAGVILGTAAYMAPEQAKGKPADRRSDIWSFGVVLYEMLTGAPMFGGDSVPDTLASVMRDQITFGKLPHGTPPAIRTLVSRCLERDPRRRLQSIGEARIALEDVIAGTTATGDESRPQPAATRPTKWLQIVAAASSALLIAAVAWIVVRPTPGPAAPAVMRFTVPPAEGTALTLTGPNASHLALSPNGRYLAYVADESGRERTLWVRALDSLAAQRLDRTEGAAFPFWSPDSQQIAFFANGKLMRVSFAGGAPLTIADALAPEGGTWFQTEGQDGVIVFAPDSNGPLMRVSAQGGVPKQVTTLAPGENGHAFPQFLPDGRRLLYLARGDRPGIYVQTLGSDERTLVISSIGRAAYSPPGLLLFMRENTLLGQRWNTDTLRLEGEPVPIAENVRSGGNNGRNAFTVSASGVLAYRGGGSIETAVVTYTRDGKVGENVLPPGDSGALELSPDDNLLVVIRGTGQDRDLWLKDLTSGVYSRLTSAPGPESDQVWAPDSRRVAYGNTQSGKDEIFETVIGSGKHTPVPRGNVRGFLTDWTRDGMLLLNDRGTITALPALQPDGKPAQVAPKTLVSEKYAIDQVRVSPDGKWVAYTSSESGQPEITLAAFPAFADRRQISSGGAVQPLWRADGRELFFVGRDQMLRVVDVAARGDRPSIGPVRTLFQTRINPSAQVHMYGVTRDGKRFIVREPLNRVIGTDEQLFVVANWPSLIAR